MFSTSSGFANGLCHCPHALHVYTTSLCSVFIFPSLALSALSCVTQIRKDVQKKLSTRNRTLCVIEYCMTVLRCFVYGITQCVMIL
jgi:hypothetical protein